MTRKKVKLAFITNDSSRKATFKKRKKGLMKKVSELSTLCEIDACAIIYSPYDPQLEVWPSQLGVHKVLNKFRKMPELEQSKKMMNQESYLRQRIEKAKDQLIKQRKDNREKQMTQLMFQYLSDGQVIHNISMVDLNDMAWLIDQYLKEINRRVELLNKNSQGPIQMANIKDNVQGSHSGKELNMNMDVMQKQHWLMNLMDGGGGGGDGTPLLRDVCPQNGFWSNPFSH